MNVTAIDYSNTVIKKAKNYLIINIMINLNN